jgi:ATP-dependent DNA ligase
MLWSISVKKIDPIAIIITRRGYKDGKMQFDEKTITEGKNIGKKNETTPYQQAVAEAKSAWMKKTESGYTRVDEITQEEEEEQPVSRSKGIDETVPLPMLAHDYNKRGKSIQFPCFVQKKLDGTRCVGIPQQGLFSRNRKSYPHMEHIVEELNRLPHDVILDGELYSTELTFQEIVGLVKKNTLKAGEEEKQQKIQFHVYDLINEMPYSHRYDALQALFSQYKFKHLVLVQTEICESEEKMIEMHAQYVENGYEGIMLRNKHGIYENNRSIHLQKYKEFFDMECKIVGYKEGEGAESGCVIWMCELNGKQFACRPRGTREEREALFQEGDAYVGKMLSVRYQEMTDEGLLRFPVGLAIRDYE